MNSIKSIFVLTLCTFFLFSCTKKTEDKTPNHGTPSTKLYPLSSGNSWSYEVTTYDSMNNPTISQIEQKVINTTFVQGDTFYVISGINLYYRSTNDGLTLIANSERQTTTRYQYHNGPDSIQKIGELYLNGYIDNYYSKSGTYNYKYFKDCFCFRTETMNRGNLAAVVFKYLKPGIGIVGMEQFSHSKDANGQSIYKLYQTWELKDYYLYP
jgi:hypothetical protein